jgi:hypothetical protein
MYWMECEFVAGVHVEFKDAIASSDFGEYISFVKFWV